MKKRIIWMEIFLIIYLGVFSLIIISQSVVFAKKGISYPPLQGIIVFLLGFGVFAGFIYARRFVDNERKKFLYSCDIYMGVFVFFTYYIVHYLFMVKLKLSTGPQLMWFLLVVPPRYLSNEFKLELNKNIIEIY